MTTLLTPDSINAPALSHSRFIALSALAIINAGILANDPKMCALEARRIYGSHNHGGMWAKVRADARKLLRLCDKEGITFVKPYKIVREGNLGLVCTVSMGLGFFPAFWVGAK